MSDTTSDNGDRIIALDKERMQAMADKDIAKLNNLLCNAMIYTHSSSRLDTKESLIENMETGILVPVDDAILMARAIRGVLDDDNLAERIARQGLKAYQDNFTEAQVVEQYFKFFEQVTG